MMLMAGASQGRTGDDGGERLLHRRYDARRDAVSQARRAAVAALADAGIEHEPVQSIELALTEACANAVLHAYNGTRPKGFTVSLTRRGDGLEVVVADEGVGMRPRTDSPGLGLGLPLMATLSEELEVRVAPDGGTEIHMRFPLAGDHGGDMVELAGGRDRRPRHHPSRVS